MMCSCRFPVFSPPTHSPQWPTGDKVGGPFGDSNRGGAFVLPLIMVGMTEASTTRNPSTPCTFNPESTTFPMLQVLVGWWKV